MWEPHSIPLAKQEENPERRAISRVHTAIPVTINLVGAAEITLPITVHTADISPRGLSTVINLRIVKMENGHVSIQEEVKNSARMIKHLVVHDRIVGLGIHILPQGGSVHAMGTVRWHAGRLNEGLYSMKTGILLSEIDRVDKNEWFGFLRAIYEHLACFRYETAGPLSPG